LHGGEKVSPAQRTGFAADVNPPIYALHMEPMGAVAELPHLMPARHLTQADDAGQLLHLARPREARELHHMELPLYQRRRGFRGREIERILSPRWGQRLRRPAQAEIGEDQRDCEVHGGEEPEEEHYRLGQHQDVRMKGAGH
ncbi:unnamed protein product, partial [Musa hybrid cultivar]